MPKDVERNVLAERRRNDTSWSKPRPAARHDGGRVDPLLELRRRVGNRAIAELLRPGSARHLDPGLRAFMEARLGYDLGHVRVRTDAAAAAAAAALDADAFAVGGDVVFGAGRYEPGTSEGRRLLAHELAHAVQQRDHPGVGAARAAGLRVDPSEQAEHAADAVAGSVAAGPIPTLPVTAGTLGAPAVQRQAASARERARGRPPEIAPQVVQEMKGDVERIVERLRQQVLPSSQEWEIVGLVRKWAEADARDRERTGHGETGHLDRFLAELKRRVYSRSTARSGWVEQWASAYDDLWYELEDERLEAFKELVATSRTQAGTGPLSQRTANLWGVLGKQEAIGLWGMLKGMGTGAAGLVDEGAWAVTKALRAQGVDVADPESAAAWLEEQYDFSGEVMFGAEWKSGEKLFLGMSAAEIGTSGGGIIWQLVMLGSGKTAPAWVKGALRVFGIASNLKGINDSASAIADIIAKRQEKGPVDFAKLLQDAAFLEQVTKLTANVVGAIAAGRTSSTQAGQATAAALSRIGILLDGAQASAQIGRLIEIATSEMSSQAKEEAAGKVVVQLIHSGIAIATGAKSHHEEFGGKQQRPSTQTTAVPPTKPPAKAPAPPGPPGRRPPGVTEIVGEPVILPSKPKGKVVGSTAEASATPSTEPVVLTDERGRVVGEKPVAPKGKTVGLVNPERQRVYEKGKRRGEPLPEQRTKEQRAAFEKALGPFRQPAKAGPAKGGATEVPPPPLVLSPQAAAAKPPPAEGPVILGPDKKPMRGAPASRGFVRAPSGEQVVAGARVRLDEPLGVAVPPGTTRYGTEAQSVIINRRYPGPDVTPLPFAFPAFDAVQGGTVTPVLAGQGRAGALKKGVRIEGGTAISIKAIDAAAAKSYATAESTYSSMKPWVDVAADYPGGGAVSLSQDVGGEPVQYTVVNPTKRVLHVELAVTPTNEQMDGFARLRNYAEDRGVELRLVAPNQVRPRP